MLKIAKKSMILLPFGRFLVLLHRKRKENNKNNN